jgi:asparagine synthetase B (glutamine-hydrolysing)|tara:strand:+ start:8 stop:253 length:246 start_codon:yes stop_codon:yes gene_type:complete
VEPEQILNSLRRAIKRRVDTLAISVTSGGVDSMETYKYIIGQINALESVQQEISNLLNDKEQNEDRGTVINIGDKKNNNPK